MKTIPLTQGHSALVDDQDYERVAQFRWHALKSKRRNQETVFYAARNEYQDGKRGYIYMHCFIMGSKGIDHYDSDGLNNQRQNLRSATQSENIGNARKDPKSTSAFKGVCWFKPKNKWQARIKKDYKTYSLGYFADEIDAAQAYNFAAEELFGEFARLNKPLDYSLLKPYTPVPLDTPATPPAAG